MKAITVRQPWAWAIVHGGKNVENRTRNIAGTYRGPLAIHAGLTTDEDAMDNQLIWAAVERGETKAAWLRKGVILGVVDLIDVHTCQVRHAGVMDIDCCQPWGQHEYVEIRALCETEPQVTGTVQHLVLANPRPLATPIPARGQLGLWTPDAELLDQINHQVDPPEEPAE